MAIFYIAETFSFDSEIKYGRRVGGASIDTQHLKGRLTL